MAAACLPACLDTTTTERLPTKLDSKQSRHYINTSVLVKGAALLVGRSRDRSPVVSLGIFSEASDKSMLPGVDSASKNEYQDIPGGKGGRCVGATTLPPSCAECQEIWEPQHPGPLYAT